MRCDEYQKELDVVRSEAENYIKDMIQEHHNDVGSNGGVDIWYFETLSFTVEMIDGNVANVRKLTVDNNYNLMFVDDDGYEYSFATLSINEVINVSGWVEAFAYLKDHGRNV